MPEPIVDIRSCREERAFEAYKRAAERAQRTLLFEDAAAAGRAWRTFIDLYLAVGARGRLVAGGAGPPSDIRPVSPHVSGA